MTALQVLQHTSLCNHHLATSLSTGSHLSHLDKDYIKEAANPSSRADAIGATASHELAAGSYRSTELREAPLWLCPPTAYSLPSSAAAARVVLTVVIGATASHAFVTGSYRSTELRTLS